MTKHVKSFFHEWCDQNHVKPEFKVWEVGKSRRGQPVFQCEIAVEGLPYIGIAVNSSKKLAARDASRDYLIICGVLFDKNALEVPEVPQTNINKRNQQSSNNALERIEEPKFIPFLEAYPEIHGYWNSAKIAKRRLGQFMHENSIKAEIKNYSQIGSDENKRFGAEMSVFVEQLGRKLTSRESGPSKTSAKKSCCLSIVRQLYHFGIIGPYNGQLEDNNCELDL